MLQIGDKAPDFCLLNKNDQEVCSESFRGKWLILYFYPKDNTKGCTLEAIDFSDSLAQFSQVNATVIGISPDSVKSHLNFANRHNLTVALLSDPERKVLENYGVWQLKRMYGREYVGVERSTFIINPSGTVAAVFRRVKVKGHVEEVKKKLEGLRNRANN